MEDPGPFINGYAVKDTLHIMDGQSRVARLDVGHRLGDTTPELKYILDDHLGNSTGSVDDSGSLISKEEYYPFGETAFGSYGKKRYKFNGKERDEESGLYYYGARYYNAWTCRFVSVDPMVMKYPNKTPYHYCSNNPINRIDPSGMEDKQGGGKKGSNTTQVTGTKSVIGDKPKGTTKREAKLQERYNNLLTDINNMNQEVASSIKDGASIQEVKSLTSKHRSAIESKVERYNKTFDKLYNRKDREQKRSMTTDQRNSEHIETTGGLQEVSGVPWNGATHEINFDRGDIGNHVQYFTGLQDAQTGETVSVGQSSLIAFSSIKYDVESISGSVKDLIVSTAKYSINSAEEAERTGLVAYVNNKEKISTLFSDELLNKKNFEPGISLVEVLDTPENSNNAAVIFEISTEGSTGRVSITTEFTGYIFNPITLKVKF